MEDVIKDQEKVLISQNVDTSNQFFDGLGWLQFKYLIVTSPIYLLVMYFPLFHYKVYWVDLCIRVSISITLFVLIVLLLRSQSIRGASITDIEILLEKISFIIRKKSGKTMLVYSKFRK